VLTDVGSNTVWQIHVHGDAETVEEFGRIYEIPFSSDRVDGTQGALIVIGGTECAEQLSRVTEAWAEATGRAAQRALAHGVVYTGDGGAGNGSE
jgi:hypothetical protein